MIFGTARDRMSSMELELELEADVLDREMALEDESSDLDDLAENGPETPTGKDGEMIESYDKRELIAHQVGVDTEPYEGMEFDSEDSARAFYYAYATREGFRVRVSRCQRSMRDGTIICRRFVCSREGFYMQKNQASNKRQRKVTRVGCLAMLLVKKQSPGKWVVSKFVKEHNHEPAAPRKMDLKPCVVMKVKKLEDYIEEKEGPAEKELPMAELPRGNPDLEPYEGLEFLSEEAARTFYYAYAKDMGFTVRISKCRRARDGLIICRRFVCSKEGFYVRKYGRTKRSRALTRVGCLARLVVKRLDSGTWVVANFEKGHNHPPFVTGQELSYQPPKPTRHINRGARASLPASSGSLLNWTDTESQNSENSATWRFNKLHQQGIRFAEEGATSVEIFNVAMLALREATQKVVAAKSNAIMAPLLDSLVSSSNHGVNTNQVNWALANNSGNQATLSNQQCSSDVRQAASPNGVMLIQQPVNLVLFASGLPNEDGQVPSAINLHNGQAVQGGEDNLQINITIPVAVQKQLSPAEHSLDGNGSVGSDLSEGRKQKYKTAEDDVENFITIQDYNEGDSKQDGVATQPQGWNIVGMGQSGSNTGSGGNSSNVTLSEAQVAALDAVAEAFNVPTMGATSSSALPIKVQPVSDEGNKVVVGASLETPPGPNPLVHAAAIAAGARIAPPSVAASLIKAVQSRTCVHIRSPVPRAGVVRDSLSPPGVHQNSNIHYFPSVAGPWTQLVSSGGGITEAAAMETSGIMQSSLVSAVEQTGASLEEDQTMTMYHSMDLAEQQT